jgi:hypothetical protein
LDSGATRDEDLDGFAVPACESVDGERGEAAQGGVGAAVEYSNPSTLLQGQRSVVQYHSRRRDDLPPAGPCVRVHLGRSDPQLAQLLPGTDVVLLEGTREKSGRIHHATVSEPTDPPDPSSTTRVLVRPSLSHGSTTV